MSSNSSFDDPYRPPAASIDYVPATSVPLEFLGEITQSDYKRMLPTTMDIVWGRVMFSLGLVVLLPLLAATGVMVFQKIPGAGVAVTVASLVVAVAISVAIYLVSPSARAYRYLRGNTDLLGPAKGTLSERGLMFDDGNCKHWFSWPSLHAVSPRADGIRVSLDSRPNRFLALSSRIFLTYSRKHADRIVAEFARRKRTTDELQLGSGEMFEKSLTDDGFFSGTISVSQSLKSAELRATVISGLVTGIFLILVAVSAVGYWRLISILGVYCLAGSAQSYWQYMYGSKVSNHLAWGWIDSSGLIYAFDSRATWRPRTAFNKIVPCEQYFEFHLVGGECLFVYVEHMKNPTEFIRVAYAWKIVTAASQLPIRLHTKLIS